MPSLPETSALGKPVLVCLANLLSVLLLVGCSGARGASLREHRLRGTEPDSPTGDAYQVPNTDMLKALQYIEGLHQRTGADPQQRPPAAPGPDAELMDDTEKLRAMLRLASGPAQASDKDEEGEEEEGAEDKSEELLQAVLSTLQQTEQASKPEVPSQKADVKDSRAQQKQRGIMPHKKLPLMFEDEEGEGDEEEEEDEGTERDSPFKRTNENVEEKYTPQNMATLQSVFDELDKLTSPKALHKRQDEEDSAEEGEEDNEEEDDDADDMFDVRNVAYDDFGGDLMDWGPIGEQEEEEEDLHDKHEADRGLDYIDDNDEEADEEDEDEDGERYPAKRSQEPDDVANLVDYYLLKVLEKTEEEEQKRELEEEEEEAEEEEEEKTRAERRAAQSIDPRVIYQLIQVSQKYQIPPEDLLDMLRTRDRTSQTKLRLSNRLAQTKSRLSQLSPKRIHTLPESRFHTRRPPYLQKSPEQLRTEEILRVLGLGGAEDTPPVWRQRQRAGSPSRLRAPSAARPGEPAPTLRRLPAPARYEYEDGAGEDELAAYLAAQMLSQYPKPAKRDEAGRGAGGSLERAMEEYFDQMDSDKSQDGGRRTEDEERGGGAQEQGGEDEAVMTLLSFLNPETDESDAKAAQGN